MNIEDVPVPLRLRLGPDATGGLVELLDLAHREGRADVIAACTERFERRLVDEVSAVRVQIAQVESSLRVELAQMGAGIRQEMAQMGADIRQEIASGRVELFKWCFLFWVGQVLAMAGMMGVMVRLFRP